MIEWRAFGNAMTLAFYDNTVFGTTCTMANSKGRQHFGLEQSWNDRAINNANCQAVSASGLGVPMRQPTTFLKKMIVIFHSDGVTH
jgi:hypothetical protein